MKLLSLFSGIGAFEKALDRLAVPYELVNFSEIDKYAIKSYCAIHGVDESKNLGDITKVDEAKLPNDIDLVTYGFPCQDISVAGKQKGLINEDGTKTRSGLFFEALRIIEATQPKVAIAENVKNLISKKFNAQFQVVLASLESAGYNNYYKVLNAKDFGIPQNRERVFIVSIRKDIDTGKFEFPHPFPLEKRLKDVLEEVVEEKYYLKETAAFFIKNSFDMEAKGNGFRFEPHVHKNANIAKTITTRAGGRMDVNFVLDADIETSTFKFDSKNPQLKQVGQMYPSSGNPQAGRIYDADGISPTMDTCSGGNRMPKVAVAMRGRYNQDGEVEQHIEVSDRECANAITTVQKDSLVGEPLAYDEQNRYIRKDGCVGTIMTDGSSPKKNNRIVENSSVWVSEKGVKYILSPKRGMCTDVNADVIQPLTAKGQANWTGSFVSPDIESLEKNTTIGGKEPVKIKLKNGETITSNDDTSRLRIRKLTPLECFRLMGFDDESFCKAEAVNSNSQLYKQAGNSIVVDVLECLLCMMIDSNGEFYV